MVEPLTFSRLTDSNTLCTIDLAVLFGEVGERAAFDARWAQFLNADSGHRSVLKRDDNLIIYSHKSWLPEIDNGKPTLLFLFGNPAPQSVLKDVYFSFEGAGREHRFWKVLRELGFIDLNGSDRDIKAKFLALNYDSPFRLGLEVIYSFPSSSSNPQWSGVAGVERLFGRKAARLIMQSEKVRIHGCIERFMNGSGAIVAMQKDAYNAVSQNEYELKLAVKGTLHSLFERFNVYGVPPTRLLYSKNVKARLSAIYDQLSAIAQ